MKEEVKGRETEERKVGNIPHRLTPLKQSDTFGEKDDGVERKMGGEILFEPQLFVVDC